jgi:hypothetical protein
MDEIYPESDKTVDGVNPTKKEDRDSKYGYLKYRNIGNKYEHGENGKKRKSIVNPAISKDKKLSSSKTVVDRKNEIDSEQNSTMSKIYIQREKDQLEKSIAKYNQLREHHKKYSEDFIKNFLLSKKK